MEYQKYIDLGFERTDMSCNVEFKQTGYHGFALEKKVNEKQMVCVTSGELDNPKLYIKKRNSETYHIIPISTETVIDLFSKSENIDYMTTACQHLLQVGCNECLINTQYKKQYEK